MYIPLRIGLTVVERIPRIFFLLWPQIFFFTLFSCIINMLNCHMPGCVYFSTKRFLHMKPRLALHLSKRIFSKRTQHNYMNNLKAEFYQLVVKGDVRDSKRGNEGLFCCLPEDGGSHVSGTDGKSGGAENRPWMRVSKEMGTFILQRPGTEFCQQYE